MQPLKPPKATAVEVVATRPTEADSSAIAYLSSRTMKPLPQIAYLVKIRFAATPPVTSQGWALYVNHFRIPKYWAYKKGIYFKVFDAQFFVDHKGRPLRFSQNGTEFVDTGLKLPPPSTRPKRASSKLTSLPRQIDVLK